MNKTLYKKQISFERGIRIAPEPAGDKGIGKWDAFTYPNPMDTDSKTVVSVANTQPTDPNPIGRTVEAEFADLADRWHEDTDPLSVESEITDHPAYWRIVAKGKAVVPCILRDLERRGGMWYRALEAIEGFSLPPAEEHKDVRKMKEAWLAWGRDQHLTD